MAFRRTDLSSAPIKPAQTSAQRAIFGGEISSTICPAASSILPALCNDCLTSSANGAPGVSVASAIFMEPAFSCF